MKIYKLIGCFCILFILKIDGMDLRNNGFRGDEPIEKEMLDPGEDDLYDLFSNKPETNIFAIRLTLLSLKKQLSEKKDILVDTDIKRLKEAHKIIGEILKSNEEMDKKAKISNPRVAVPLFLSASRLLAEKKKIAGEL